MALFVMYSCPRVEVRMCVHMCASVSAMAVVFGCAEVIVMTPGDLSFRDYTVCSAAVGLDLR